MPTTHGRSTPLVWLTVDKSTLKDHRSFYEHRVLVRLAELLPAGIKVCIVADRGFGDQKLYKMLTEELYFDYVIRFRGNITVTTTSGETRTAAEWVQAGGHARVLRGAEVTADRYRVGTVPDGKSYFGQGEIHFGWILEGRAIQDVWMIPRLQDGKPGVPPMPIAGNWYGTTLRIYDPAIDAWRIYWIDPATNAYRYQIGRQQGKDIVQKGKTESGTHSRWSFTEITRDSFRWLAETSTDGKTWGSVVEVRARRASAQIDMRRPAPTGSKTRSVLALDKH
jgi:hypothetical protein